ncbi:MAG: trypsin-like peptidase domain-containing protein [Planctomycetota bacterium]
MRTLAFLLCLAAAASAGPDLQKLNASIVKIFCYSQPEDYSRPWRSDQAFPSTGSGFFIGNRMIMTNGHVVGNERQLMVKRADRSKRYEARMLFAGHDCDLAVITVDDDSFWEGMEKMEIGARPGLQSTVACIGYPQGGEKLAITEGVVSRIDMRNYVHTYGDSHLTIQIDAAINPGNSGGPVVQGKKVVGVAFQGQRSSQAIGYMIPPSVIRHFLTDIKDGKYHGYPDLGIVFQPLENPTLKEYLGLPKEATGVVVLKPLPFSSVVGHVRRDDVIHAIDGIPVEDNGKIKIDGEELDMAIVVEGKQVGEAVTLTIRRDGKVSEIEVPLKKWAARMKVSLAYDEKPEYLVKGGYVFVPLSLNYVIRQRRGREDLLYFLRQYYLSIYKDDEKREQLVILSRVLPHPTTRYRTYANSIVSAVDGKPPRDFAEFVKLVESATGELIKIDFEGVNVAPLILDKKKLAAVNQKILQRNGIVQDRHVEKEAG